MFQSQIVSQYGEEKVHLVKECPTSYHNAHLVRRGWAHADIFNQKIQRLVESGFFCYWSKSYRSALQLHWMMNHHRGIKRRNIQLDLRNVQLWFLWLVVGNSLALIVFGYEVLENWIKKRRLAVDGASKRHTLLMVLELLYNILKSKLY